MLKKLKTIVLMVVILLHFSSVFSFAYADCGDNGSSSGNTYNYTSASNCPPTLNFITQIAVSIVQTILVIAGIVFFFMIVLNGFNYLTSLGDPEKIQNAGKGLTFTIIGFSLIFLSFVIINIVSNVVGLAGGFSVGTDGNIHFNILSPFTATSLPANQSVPTQTK